MKYFETSKIEIIDITKAWIVISAAFAIVLTRDNLFSTKLLFNFLLAGLTVGIGFLFHELSHKVIAQKYGAIAEFRAFDSMLVLALVISFLGFVFAAPGAVMIVGGHINIKRNGKISVAGPLMNLFLALIFFIIMKLNFSAGINTIGQYGFFINSWLALFNMIPFWNFDGRKIFVWNKIIWVSIVIVAVIFLFVL
jgi:Zn-dependent protease